MREREFRYVRHEDVDEYVRKGWKKHYGLEGTHHGEYSVLMENKNLREPSDKTDFS